MSQITFTYDEKKRELAREYLKDQGFSIKDAISIFLDAVVMNEGMPNAAALEDAEDIFRAEKAEMRIQSCKSKFYTSDKVRKILDL